MAGNYNEQAYRCEGNAEKLLGEAETIIDRAKATLLTAQAQVWATLAAASRTADQSELVSGELNELGKGR
jgi:hypothetical protein